MTRRVVQALLLAIGLCAAAVATAQDDAMTRGDRAWRTGDVASALTAWSEVLAAAREANDGPAVVDAALRLAAAHRGLGRVDTAAAAVALAGAHAGADTVASARVRTAAGQVALARGDAPEAQRLLVDAYEAHRRLGDPSGAATAALSLGAARLARGELEAARRAFTTAATLFETLGDDAGRADARTNLGVTALRAGDPRSATVDLEAARALHERVGDAGGVIDASIGLGRAHEALGDDERASTVYEEALERARARKDLTRQATLQQNLGALAHRAGDPGQARARYGAADEAWRAAGRPREAVSVALNVALLDEDPLPALEITRERAEAAGDGRVQALAAMAIAWESTDRARATAAAREATALADALGTHDLRWRTALVRARLARDAGESEVALRLLREVVREVEGIRPSEAAFAHPLGAEVAYRMLVGLLVERGEATEALHVAERLQRHALHAPRELGDIEADALDAEARYVEERLGEAERSDAGSEESVALRERLAALRVAFAATVDRLRASDPDFDRRVRVAPEDLEAVQARLPPDVTVLQPILYDDRLVLLVFRHDAVEARVVDVAGAEVREVSARLARSLRAGLTTRPEWTRAQADQLGAWLLAPIADVLAHTQTLVISATDPFRQLPFAMLRHDDAWLVERVAVVGITHVGSLLGEGTRRPPSRFDGADLLLLGDPDGSLPGAASEVRALAERFPGAGLLLGEAGTREAIARLAPGRSTLHLATHGRIDPLYPDRSHLVLAGPAGRLTYAEIPGLAPSLAQCRLVVLSACESGLPVSRAQAAPDAELPAINGLAAQFRRAGVETLVATLWRVDDAATRALMMTFYERLSAGDDIASALRAAQREALASEARAHPWFWGAFVVMGDWR